MPITIKVKKICIKMIYFMVCFYQTDSWISCLTIHKDLTA